jgi:hypothetical protein
MAAHCWASMKRNEDMHNGFSNVSWFLFALFALKNSQRFLQFGSIREHPRLSTQLGAQNMQKKR